MCPLNGMPGMTDDGRRLCNNQCLLLFSSLPFSFVPLFPPTPPFLSPFVCSPSRVGFDVDANLSVARGEAELEFPCICLKLGAKGQGLASSSSYQGADDEKQKQKIKAISQMTVSKKGRTTGCGRTAQSTVQNKRAITLQIQNQIEWQFYQRANFIVLVQKIYVLSCSS